MEQASAILNENKTSCLNGTKQGVVKFSYDTMKKYNK